MRHLAQIARGFLMGSADIVPGVSGGTVALVLGIYERLVHAIRTVAGALGSLLRGRPREAGERAGRVDWGFLLPLLAGIAAALVTLAAVIDRQLQERPIGTAAVFFGLVAGSIVIAWRLIRDWSPVEPMVAIGVAVAAYLLLGLRGGEIGAPAAWEYLLAGMVAIVAMILPGISGSFILLILGMYQAVIGAVDDRDLAVLAVFGVGAIAGLAAFSTLLDWLLEHHHDLVMAALIGLMAGSLRVLWPWPDGVDTASVTWPSGGEWVGGLLLATAAALVVLGLGRLAGRPPAE